MGLMMGGNVMGGRMIGPRIGPITDSPPCVSSSSCVLRGWFSIFSRLRLRWGAATGLDLFSKDASIRGPALPRFNTIYLIYEQYL